MPKTARKTRRPSAWLDEAGIETEFMDAIALLRRRALRERAQILLDGARDRYLSPAETLELEDITRQLAGIGLV